MNSNCHPFYKHSGKFGPHGPILALAAAAVVAYPLGIAYGYLIKWIPFIYLNFLITVGYGLAFGFLTLLLLKVGKVRNGAIALLCGFCAGTIAWYFSWNGCVHTLAGKSVPWALNPGQMWRFVKFLNQEGSWGIGHSADATVTGIPLAIVWIIEGGVIVGASALISFGMIAHTPFCETHDCWLDSEKKIDTLDAFTNPEHLAAFKNGDIAPLDQARARVPASGRFARLALKHSDQCHDYCALSIANVTVTLDKNGKPVEKTQDLMSNLWVPKTMFDYLAKFEHPTAKV